MADRVDEPVAGDPGAGGLDRYLKGLAEELAAARQAGDPASRARHLARLQRMSGWALRQAVTEYHGQGGTGRQDTARFVDVQFGTLYRRHQAGGRITGGDDAPPRENGPPHREIRDDRTVVPEEDDRRRTGVEFLILGEMVVRSRERMVPLPGPSVRALLGALLLASGDIAGEDRLLELAWGAEKGSRRALQCAVHRLRAWLREVAGPRYRLEHAGSGYRLTVPDGAVDITRFRDRMAAGAMTGDPERRMALLSAALKEWRGPVLGGRPEWLAADPAVRAVEQARVDCAGELADLAFRLGRPAEAIALVGEVAAAAPYDEPLQARLVRLLSACGRHAEALRHVERVRQRLADDLGVAPSREVRNAHTAALRGDDRPAASPRQLPSDVPDFTGRRREIAAISEPMLSGRDRGGPLVFAIDGPAGVGKTALAVHVAHRAAALFADGQLYAELRGSGSRPVDPADILGRFLRALGVDDAVIPCSLDDRAALYRSRTAGRRLLVLLDNAVDEAQVRPLVPAASGCAVLVTGRISLAGLTGARPVRLDVPGTDDAVRLLGRVCGRDGATGDPAVREIADLCGRLPLAVRIAGARLATRPELSPGQLAARLRDPDRRLDELAAGDLAIRPSLEAGYRDLPPAQRRVFRLLGLLPPAGFTPRAAAALLGVSPDGARTRLESLVDARLLDPLGEDETGQPRYRMPDLLRLYARERARAEEPGFTLDAALRRSLGEDQAGHLLPPDRLVGLENG
ncbi:AfsR/SARP family transcriptional regulator [Thermomonospora echinospora]|nr:BTAD domain-containing putative transcriptional regulator [Thermomonospora echinospora]